MLPKRSPNDRGQGRKPLDPAGEVMRVRHVRMTDAQWHEFRARGSGKWLRVLLTAPISRAGVIVETVIAALTSKPT